MKTEYDKKESIMKKIDFMQLREKGMTKDKISKIVGVPVYVIEKQLRYQKEYKKCSGVF